MNDRLVTLLSSNSRTELLKEIDANVGREPDAADIERMRRVVPSDLVTSANVLLDIVLGTRKAQKLGKGRAGWWYTTQGAEQATHPMIAEHHARPFKGLRHVLEVCTGVGADTFALARSAKRVTTFESDAVTAALATGNFRASNLENVTVRCEAFGAETALEALDGLWADPSRRRADGRRAMHIRDYSPLLETLTAVANRFPGVVAGIKCGPGDDIPAPLAKLYTSEYTGMQGECRERVLWKNANVCELTVSLLDVDKQWSPSADDLHARNADNPSSQNATSASSSNAPVGPGDLLVEPHPALIASGAVGAFFSEHGLRPIHELIAYGIGTNASVNLLELQDWAAVFEIVRVDQGVAEKRIQQNLRDLQWNNRTEFKKRGWNGEPEALRRKLEFATSDVYGVVVIARTERGHLTLFCKRLPA